MVNKNGEDHAQDQVPILLSQKERDEREAIAAKGKHNSQKVLNALILLDYNEDAPKPRTFGEQDITSGLDARVNWQSTNENSRIKFIHLFILPSET